MIHTVHCDFDAHSVGTGASRDDHVAVMLTVIETDGTRRVEYIYDPPLPLHSFSVFQSLT